VIAAQRERILRATAEVMAGKGYGPTSVADIIRAAGVSRETFYEQFASKSDCFMSAYEAAAEMVMRRLPARATGGPADPVARFDRGISAYLEALAAEPEFARLFLVEVYAAGAAAIDRRMQTQAAFASHLRAELAAEQDAFAVDALVAAISAMVTAKLAAGDLAGLRGLREPLTGLVARALDAR
jgi:AcrR family transcriptional regulator